VRAARRSVGGQHRRHRHQGRENRLLHPRSQKTSVDRVYADRWRNSVPFVSLAPRPLQRVCARRFLRGVRETSGHRRVFGEHLADGLPRFGTAACGPPRADVANQNTFQSRGDPLLFVDAGLGKLVATVPIPSGRPRGLPFGAAASSLDRTIALTASSASSTRERRRPRLSPSGSSPGRPFRSRAFTR
jgi:hypothetical protein